MSAQRCACGHYQLPTYRDAVVALPGGQSDQHGRLHCERITLGREIRHVEYHDRRGKLLSEADVSTLGTTLTRLDRH